MNDLRDDLLRGEGLTMRQAIDEEDRIAALLRYEILDTRPDARWTRLTQMLRDAIGASWAAVSFVDRERQWFKAKDGLDLTETQRSISFCSVCIHGSGPLIVEDAARDPRFSGNPLVTGPLQLRFYAGFPIFSREGFGLGSVCVGDTLPRTLFPQHLELLSRARDWVQAALEMRRLDRQSGEAECTAAGAQLAAVQQYARLRADEAWAAVSTLRLGRKLISRDLQAEAPVASAEVAAASSSAAVVPTGTAAILGM